ncbi:hypothetical protein ACSQ67_024317 [Phaseolus vulgaris]
MHLNFSLKSNDSVPWNSPSGHFAFGFQTVLYDNNEFMSVLAVWFAKDPNETMVWYAKPRNKFHLFPYGSTMNLTDKGIVVYDPKGHEVLWHRPENNTVSLVSCASVLDDGSFELVDESGKKVWESFEEPTDTILPGQNLSRPRAFRARQSETSFDDGSFQLSWQMDGNLVLYFLPKSSTDDDDESSQSAIQEAYWSTGTHKTGSQLFFDESGHMYIKNDTGSVISEITYGGSDEFFYMARIDPDGVFRLYRHPKGDHTTVANSHAVQGGGVWRKSIRRYLPFLHEANRECYLAVLTDYCVTIEDKTNCECPDHYSPFEHDKLTGCRPDFPLPSCNKEGWEQNKDLVDFKELLGTRMNKDMCRQKCLEDCFCLVAIYGEESYWKKKYPLSNGRMHHNVTRIALMKVPKTDLNNGGKEQNTLVLVVSILLGSSVLINVFLLVALFVAFFIFYHKRLLNGPNLSVGTVSHFTYKELEEATTGFKQVLGRGAFGTIYKGVLASNTSRYVACEEARQGYARSVAFALESEEEALIDWAYRCYSHGKVAKLVENDEEAKSDIKRVENHVMVAIWCIQEDPSLGPSMKKITQMLEGVTIVSCHLALLSSLHHPSKVLGCI